MLRPVSRLFSHFQSLYVSGDDIGRAMLQVIAECIRWRVVENRETRAIARREIV